MKDEEIEKVVDDFVRVATMSLAPQLTSEHGPLTAEQLPEAQSRLRRSVEVALRSLVSQAVAEQQGETEVPLLEGEIRVGDKLIWEPDIPRSRKRVTVIEVKRYDADHASILTKGRLGEFWNDESRVREACVRDDTDSR